MRVLIAGGTGMLGHKLLQKWSGEFELAATIRGKRADSPLPQLALDAAVYEDIDAEDIVSMDGVLADFAPQVVVNCIGIVKQIEQAYDPVISIRLNALFPHLLAQICARHGARLIHISTDCVYSGQKGPYAESDVADADDLYGRTKRLGEATSDGACTLRTSIIGYELSRGTGLLEWFLRQAGTINGFRHALYTGFPTDEMANILRKVICECPALCGLWHVSSEPIDKYELLKLIRDVFRKDIEIHEDTKFRCDRRLDSTRFRRQTGFVPKTWREMIENMHASPSPQANN